MRFTQGYWLTRTDFDMSYATQCVRVIPSKDQMEVIACCHPVRNRGDLLDGPTLHVTFSAPRKNIIRVKLTHFEGTRRRGPFFGLNEEPVEAIFSEDEQYATFTSGDLTARVLKAEGRWQVDFLASGKLLTSSGWHGMARGLHKSGQYASLEPIGTSYMSDSLMLDVGECVYGLGERFSAYVKNGQRIDMWNADGGTCSDMAYKNIPFYMTNRGYGVFVEDTGEVSFEVASEKVERVQFSVEGETMVYDVIYGGDPKKTLDLYTALTGRPALPPAWSFGLWLSTSFTTNYDEATTSSFIDGMAQRDIPLSVFHFDCFWMRGHNWCDFEWDKETFPDPEGMIKRYHDKGLRLCCWLNPYIGQASPLFREGMEKGYLLKKRNGDLWQSDKWQPGMAILDVTNPEACAWYSSFLDKLMDMGIDCFKTDFGERIPVRDIAYYDGSDALHMHNYYTFLYNQMVFDALKRRRGEGEAVLFARSATAGGQMFPVHWGGDNSAVYISMAETLRAGLSLSHCGFGYWSHDISGFESTAPAHIYKRWCQFGLLSSHSRLHGSSSYRVPWLFDEESCDVVRKFTRLKCRLMPYLYQKAAEAHVTGTPMMRPMMLEFPDDPAVDYLDRQYMLGDALLVAPIFREDGQVQYYLPDGLWTSLLSDKKTEGGRWQTETHDFLSLPLMVRPGTVLPMGSCETHPDYDYLDNLELHIFQLPEGESRTVIVPDLKGNPAATFTVTMKNGKALVQTDSVKPWSVVVHE